MCYDIGNIIEMGDLYTAAHSDLDVTYSLKNLITKVSEETFRSLLKMFIFDFVIGNRDRHSGNFALGYDGSLAPLYDNASSLCYKMTPKRARALKENQNALLEYSLDILSHVRIPERLSNLGLMYHIRDEYSDLWTNLVHDFLDVDITKIEMTIAKFNKFVHMDILYCITYGVRTRLEYLKGV